MDPSYEDIVDNIHDPHWRLRNLYKITNKKKETVLFKPNYIQGLLEKSPSQFEAVLKARQFGISTYYLLKKLDKTMFNENQTTCILAHEQDAIKKLFRIIHGQSKQQACPEKRCSTHHTRRYRLGGKNSRRGKKRARICRHHMEWRGQEVQAG